MLTPAPLVLFHGRSAGLRQLAAAASIAGREGEIDDGGGGGTCGGGLVRRLLAVDPGDSKSCRPGFAALRYEAARLATRAALAAPPSAAVVAAAALLSVANPDARRAALLEIAAAAAAGEAAPAAVADSTMLEVVAGESSQQLHFNGLLCFVSLTSAHFSF